MESSGSGRDDGRHRNDNTQSNSLLTDHSSESFGAGALGRMYDLMFCVALVVIGLAVLTKKALQYSNSTEVVEKPQRHALSDAFTDFLLSDLNARRLQQLEKLPEKDKKQTQRVRGERFSDLSEVLKELQKTYQSRANMQQNRAENLQDLFTTTPSAFPGWDASVFYDTPWEYISTRENVQTYLKQVPHSPLLAFRGVSLMENVHISSALGPFANVTHSLAWVPVLKHIEALSLFDRQPSTDNMRTNPADHNTIDPQETQDTSNVTTELLSSVPWEGEASYSEGDLIYQVLRLPWPITTRDLLLFRHFSFDAQRRQVTVRYISVEDARRPISEEMIRALTPHTLWRFTAVDDQEDTESDEGEETTVDISQYNEKEMDLSDDPVESSSSLAVMGPSRDQTMVSRVFRRALQRFERAITVSKPLFQKIRRRCIVFWRDVKRRIQAEASSFTDAMEPALMPAVGADVEGTLHMSSSAATKTKHKGNEHCRKRSNKVLVEVETVVDSRGSIPVWFINFMQRYWPATTLSTFKKLAQAGKIPAHAAVECW